MGQVPPKSFLPSEPYGSSQSVNALNPVQAAAKNPQTPLLPPNFLSAGNNNLLNPNNLFGGNGQ